MRRFMVVAAITTALTLGVGSGWAGAGGVAMAAPAEQANCVAVLTSYFGPQGLVDDAVYVLQPIAAALGMTFGELAVMLAREHGTVEECFAVLGLPPIQP